MIPVVTDGDGSHSEIEWQIATLALVAKKLTHSLAGLNALATDTESTAAEKAEVHGNIAAAMEECVKDLERRWPPKKP